MTEPTTELPQFVLDRAFEAPVDLVWRAWTDPELLHRWYGPGVDTRVHHYDLREGGEFRYEMVMKNGFSMHGKFIYEAIEAPSLLRFQNMMTDEAGNAMRSPRAPDWPLVLMTTVTFAADGDRTNLRLVWQPHEAEPFEIEGFRAKVDGMGGGWGAGFRIIDEILAELQS